MANTSGPPNNQFCASFGGTVFRGNSFHIVCLAFSWGRWWMLAAHIRKDAIEAALVPLVSWLGLIERGYRKGGVPQKCVRGHASGATVCSGHVLNFFINLILIVEIRHFDAYPNRFGYISDRYQCAPVLCLEALPNRTSPPQYPPYLYSSWVRHMENLLEIPRSHWRDRPLQATCSLLSSSLSLSVPLAMSLFFCVLSLSLFLFFCSLSRSLFFCSLSLSLSLVLSLSLSRSLSLSLSFSLSLSIFLSFFLSLFLSFFLSLSLFLFLCLSLYFSICPSLSMSLFFLSLSIPSSLSFPFSSLSFSLYLSRAARAASETILGERGKYR